MSSTQVIIDATKAKKPPGPIATAIFVIIAAGSVWGILAAAIARSWLLGIPLALFYAFAAWLGLSDLRSTDVQAAPVHKGIGIAVLAVVVAAAVCACFSVILTQLHVATYSRADATFSDFNVYYLWVFADLIPGLGITKTLSWTAPVQPANAVAGIPVLVFRAFIVLGFLKALKTWWQARRKPAHVNVIESGAS